MVQQIKDNNYQGISKIDLGLRAFVIKFISIVYSFWIMIGVTVSGILLPAYLFNRVVLNHSSVERASLVQRQPQIRAAAQAYQPAVRNKNTSPSTLATEQNLRNGFRNATNTMNEARHLLRSAIYFAGR